MAIVLCAATELEIKPALQFIKQQALQKNIEVLITGVGLMAATYQLTKYALTKQPQFMLQAGVGGSLDESLPLGEIVAVKSECIGDAIVYENNRFANLFHLGLAHADTHPWSDGKLKNKNIALLQQSGLKVVEGITVNEITTNAERIHYYKNEIKAQVESLEGAALHYVGLMENIPFLQLRSLSNYVGERDKQKWKLHEAIAHLNFELQRILVNLFNV